MLVFIKKIILFNKLINSLREHRRRTASIKKYKKAKPGNYYSKAGFDYYKCIFVHIPKAAGIAVSKALFGNYAGGHLTIKDYSKNYPENTFKKYYKFTFVRNPYHRLYSAFTYLKKGGMNDYDKKFFNTHLIDIPDFETFVLNWLDEAKLNSIIHFIPQVYFLKNTDNKIDIDFIGRFENLEEDFEKIRKVLKIDTQLDIQNKTSRSEDFEHFETNNPKAEQVKNKIYLLYKEDFECLNYPK